MITNNARGISMPTNEKEKNLWQKTLESGVAGLVRSASTLAINPLEVIKMRLQSNAPSGVSSSTWIAQDISKNGAGILYRGVGASALLVGMKGFYKFPLFVYGPEQLALCVGDKDLFKKHPILFQCGMTPFIVIVDTVLQGPFRRLRNMLMTSEEKSSAMKIGKELSTKPTSFWKGSSSAAAKQGVGVFSTLLVDGVIRNEFHIRNWDTSHKNPYFTATAATAGVFLAIINTPLDVVASRTSSARPLNGGLFSSVNHIYTTEGYKAFTRGAGVRAVISATNSVITSLLLSWGRSKDGHSKG